MSKMSKQQVAAPGRAQFPGLLGGAVLAVWCDIDPDHDAEFNDWYTHQHLPERCSVPGFLRGRRWGVPYGADFKPGGQYFTLYEVESLQTLTSAPYMARLNSPTDWTRRTVPWFRNSNRTVCKVTASQGEGIGGFAATLEFGPLAATADALREWIVSTAMPALLDNYRITGVHLCESDESVTRAKDATAEGKVADSRGEHAPLARWFLLVESIDAEGLEAACKQLCGGAGLATQGASPDINVNRYRLLVSLAR